MRNLLSFWMGGAKKSLAPLGVGERVVQVELLSLVSVEHAQPYPQAHRPQKVLFEGTPC